MSAPLKPNQSKLGSLRVVVMAGGPSEEREVSLASGKAVSAALRDRGHRVTELDPVSPHWELPSGTDVVFLALHGRHGEDGEAQRRLEELGAPYTGCGPEASATAFDKGLTKARCVGAGIPTPRFEILTDELKEWPSDWAPPVVLKPTRQGSSVGLQFVDRREEFVDCLREARRFATDILMEERVFGRETTVGILEGEALPVVEIRPKHGVYDYHNKYTAGATEYFCPASFAPDLSSRIQAAGKAAFEAIGGRDYGRVDVMVSEDGGLWILEVNTLPGMTETSLLPKAAAAAGIDYASLCERMLELAVRRGGGKTENLES